MRLVLASLALLAVSGCDRDTEQRNREYMPDMADSVPYDSFDRNPNTRDQRTFIAAVPGTVSRESVPSPLFAPGEQEAVRAGTMLQNPIEASPAVAARGELAYVRYCSHCHGLTGQGDGPVVRLFPRPPSLTAPHAQGLPDGRLFHILTFGQGMMPAHGAQVRDADRWMIIHHLRKLQAEPAQVTP
jgi:mono/diheme cytochrome c family protein